MSGCSNGVVSFLGLQVEFPVLVCDLAAGTDAIIGTDALGSVLPHTLDIKNGLLFTEGALLFNCTDKTLLNLVVGEIDWEHPGIHRGNLITCAGSERVTDRVCSIK